jgi:hypothetical protein
VVTLGCPIGEDVAGVDYHQYLGLFDALGQINAWGSLARILAADLAQHQSRFAAGHGGRRDDFPVSARVKRRGVADAPRPVPPARSVG